MKAVVPLSSVPAPALADQLDSLPSSKDVRRALVTTVAWEALYGLLLGCVSVGYVVIVARQFSGYLTHRAAEEGLEAVRAGPGLQRDVDWGYQALWLTRLTHQAAGFGAFAAAIGIPYRRLLGGSPPAAVRVCEALLVAVPPVVAVLDRSEDASAYVVVTVACFAAFWTAVWRSTKSRCLRLLVIAEVASYFWGAALLLQLFFLLEGAATDLQRVLFRVVAHTLAMDVLTFPIRAAGRLAPLPGDVVALVSWEAAVRSLGSLLGRLQILLIESPANAALCVLLVGAVDSAMKLTLSARDGWLLRRVFRQPDSPHARAVRGHVVAFDEVVELSSTVCMAAVFIAMRVSPRDGSASASGVALSAGMQLLVEVAGDLSPALFPQRTGRAVMSKARAVRSWTRGDRLRLACFVLVMVPYVQAIIVAPYTDVFCGWSESGGWWRWVPCTSD